MMDNYEDEIPEVEESEDELQEEEQDPIQPENEPRSVLLDNALDENTEQEVNEEEMGDNAEQSEHSSDYEKYSESESDTESAQAVQTAGDAVMKNNRVIITSHEYISVATHGHNVVNVINNQNHVDDEPNEQEPVVEEDDSSDSMEEDEETQNSPTPENEHGAQDRAVSPGEDGREGQAEPENIVSPTENNDSAMEEPESAASPEHYGDNEEPKSVVSPKTTNSAKEAPESPASGENNVLEEMPNNDTNPENTKCEEPESADSPEINEGQGDEPHSAASPDGDRANEEQQGDTFFVKNVKTIPDMMDVDRNSAIAEDSAANTEPNSTAQSLRGDDSSQDKSLEAESDSSVKPGAQKTYQVLSESAQSLDEDEEVLRQLKAQIAAVDEEDGEDLEEGEIEDDEELAEKVTPVIIAKDTKDKSSKHHHHSSNSSSKDKSKEKEKESKSSKSKEKDAKSDRRRKRSDDSKDKDKSSKKRTRRSEDASTGDEDYLFIRGASPSPPLDSNPTSSPGNAGRKIYDTDPFGNPIYEDELEDFAMSPASKRRRRSRSPVGSADRRRRDNDSGGRRPTSGRKDTIKPLHKSDQICAYYMQGKCQKSHEECSFSHNAVPPRKMELCKFWMLDCCAKKEKCLYLHNDFPCKYYHTGLVCKQGLKNQCKFSHKPMNEVTKAVLLKHIETAPKEILGDFPRLNRQGALNLIAKMENRINGDLKKQERERDEERRRTRWEQPTKDDEHKLQELMEEAGLGNYYQETVEGAAPEQAEKERHDSGGHGQGHGNRDRDLRKPQGVQGMGGIAPLMGILPNQLPPPNYPPQPHLVNNPALANVLATLQIPSTTIQRPPMNDGKENNYMDRDEGRLRHEARISPDSPPYQSKDTKDDIPDNLPPIQRDIFRRIQERQLKNEQKIKDEPSDDEKADDRGWYSSDEETDKPLTEVLKEVPTKTEAEKKPLVDFASILSTLRKSTAAASNDEPAAKKSKQTPLVPTLTGRGDVDFRLGASGRINPLPNASHPSTSGQGPFRDTDFRVHPALRQEFKDVDLRMTDCAEKTPAPVFKPLPTGPATMIDASINSHPPMPWKVRVVAGVKPPDYSYVKHTFTPAQLVLDPRFGPRTAGGTSLLPDPASPPNLAQSAIGGMSPANIPGGEAVLDPRMSRRMGQIPPTTDPRPIAGGPRSITGGPMTVPPPGWPPSVDMTQAALAAQLLAAQQLGLLPFPNASGMPLMPPNLANMNSRPGFPGVGRGSGPPPASSWERYSQQQSGGVTPPL